MKKKLKDMAGITNGTQYKGNLHSHTTTSDGHLTPEQSVQMFKGHGYSFLCLSEHDRYTDLSEQFNNDSFIILPGLEASAILLENGHSKNALKVHHMHGILGNKEMQDKSKNHFKNEEILPPPIYFEKWDGAKVAQQLSDTLAEYGCIVTYNHPIWSRVLPEEFIDVKGVTALEIYNYNTVNESNTGTDTTFWDMILRSGRQMYAFASDDNHNEGAFDDACGGWINVVADELSHENIINSIIKGNYYSSCGPVIYGWGIKDNKVWVDCDRCERINMIAGGFVNAGKAAIAITNDGINSMEFDLSGNETYVRLECVDYQGKKAWTNALFVEFDSSK